tara:strand:+ start:1493 stop:1603 length:111 start_codon:yes stop_codon:yes gene_type:complete
MVIEMDWKDVAATAAAGVIAVGLIATLGFLPIFGDD